MGRAKDADLRWLVVYTRLVKGASVSVTARQCSVSKCFVKHMLKLFERTHGVEDMQGQRHAPPANQVMTAEAARALLHQMLDVPELTLGEHASNLVEDGVVATVDESTLSRVCAALRMSQKKLQVYAIQRDAERARLHVVMMVRDYTASMHLHLDETSKNRKHALRSSAAPEHTPFARAPPRRLRPIPPLSTAGVAAGLRWGGRPFRACAAMGGAAPSPG